MNDNLNNKKEILPISELVFEHIKSNQADMLVAFEKTIDTPRLYSKPLDLKAAINEINNNIYYFIKYNNELLGTIAYQIREDGSYYISNMAIGPKYRGLGVARAAMLFILKKSNKSKRVDLVTHPENTKAISLYKSFGFVIEEQIENYYNDGEPRIVMAKNI